MEVGVEFQPSLDPSDALGNDHAVIPLTHQLIVFLLVVQRHSVHLDFPGVFEERGLVFVLHFLECDLLQDFQLSFA